MLAWMLPPIVPPKLPADCALSLVSVGSVLNNAGLKLRLVGGRTAGAGPSPVRKSAHLSVKVPSRPLEERASHCTACTANMTSVSCAARMNSATMAWMRSPCARSTKLATVCTVREISAFTRLGTGMASSGPALSKYGSVRSEAPVPSTAAVMRSGVGTSRGSMRPSATSWLSTNISSAVSGGTSSSPEAAAAAAAAEAAAEAAEVAAARANDAPGAPLAR
mmetsp:Transcript_10945/g.23599  ORF Transcript_10945/g.23599 Transcript_10945/m.23599 type:complete len:221 (+) Transcript_10945:1769-2431(+)